MHLAALAAAQVDRRCSFVVAQTVATVAAIACNFFLNNLLTYRDQRLAGWRFVRPDALRR